MQQVVGQSIGLLGSITLLKNTLKAYQKYLKIRQVYSFLFLTTFSFQKYFVFYINPPTNLEGKKMYEAFVVVELNILGMQHNLAFSRQQKTREKIWIFFHKAIKHTKPKVYHEHSRWINFSLPSCIEALLAIDNDC